MKCLVICAAALMVSSAFATTITLSDGRSFKEAEIVSETPLTVVIKHSDGLSSVSKKHLPSALQEKHPLDEAAAAANEKKADIAREAAKKARDEERKKVARIMAQRETDMAERLALEEKSIEDQKRRTDSAREGAEYSLESYFRDKFSWDPGAQRTVEVTIREMRPAEGWPDRWVIKGQVLIRNFTPSPAPINTTGMSSKEARRAEYKAGRTFVEIREFEADYSTDATSTPLNVTMR